MARHENQQQLHQLIGSLAAHIDNSDDLYLLTGLGIVDSLENLSQVGQHPMYSEMMSIYDELESLGEQLNVKSSNGLIMRYQDRLRPIFEEFDRSSSMRPTGSALLKKTLEDLTYSHGTNTEQLRTRASNLIHRINRKPPLTLEQDYDCIETYFARIRH